MTDQLGLDLGNIGHGQPLATLVTRTARRLARRTDADTSHRSAANLVASGQLAKDCARVLVVLTEWTGPPPTTQELAHGDRELVHLYGRRLADLRDRGLIENVREHGTVSKRRCQYTNRLAMLWRVRTRKEGDG